MIKLNRKSE